MLTDFLQLFIQFFFPDYYKLIDWEKGYQNLDKEMIEVSTESGFTKQSADKLFKIFLVSGEEELILMHVEVQGYKDEEFARRVARYNDLIRLKYNQEVLSFIILSDPIQDFRPTGYVWRFHRHE